MIDSFLIGNQVASKDWVHFQIRYVCVTQYYHKSKLRSHFIGLLIGKTQLLQAPKHLQPIPTDPEIQGIPRAAHLGAPCGLGGGV